MKNVPSAALMTAWVQFPLRRLYSRDCQDLCDGRFLFTDDDIAQNCINSGKTEQTELHADECVFTLCAVVGSGPPHLVGSCGWGLVLGQTWSKAGPSSPLSEASSHPVGLLVLTQERAWSLQSCIFCCKWPKTCNSAGVCVYIYMYIFMYMCA